MDGAVRGRGSRQLKQSAQRPHSLAPRFGGAPIVQVSGRTYPVDVIYRPPREDETDLADAVEPAKLRMALLFWKQCSEAWCQAIRGIHELVQCR